MNVYLIQSASNELAKESMKNIINDSKNVSVYDYLQTGLKPILEEASYLSLFAEKKFIIVKNANLFGSEKAKEEETTELLKYLENPNDLSCLIFLTKERVDVRKKIVKVIKEKYSLMILDNLKSRDLQKKITAFFALHNYKADYNIASYIISCCQNNYDLIVNELNKIPLYYEDNASLTLEDLTYIIAKLKEDNNFRLIDAVIAKDGTKALAIYKDLMLYKVEPISLLTLMAREYRLTYYCKLYLRQGKSAKDIASELKLADWQVEKYLKQTYQFSLQELESKIKTLAETDYQIKSGQLDRFLALEMFLIEI